MKRILSYLILVSVIGAFTLAFASPEIPLNVVGPVGPTYATGSATSGTSSTVAAGGGGIRNCITDITAISSTIANFSIIDGTLATGTTIWGLVNVPASIVVFEDNVPEVALCGSPNTALTVWVSSGSVAMSYRGYQRNR